MTVTRRERQIYKNYSSTNNSDTESLHLASNVPSETESLIDEPTTSRARRQPHFEHFEELIVLKKSSGKKKLRRFRNKCLLETLAEEVESEDVLPSIELYKGPFTRLMEDGKALEFWNDFIEKSDEEQSAIISSMSQKDGNSEKPIKLIDPYHRISSKIKRTIKERKNQAKQLLETIENEIVEFFNANPGAVYIKVPSTSFERMLIHAVAQFHNLKSISLVSEEIKQVQVENLCDDWCPAACYLCQVITEKIR